MNDIIEKTLLFDFYGELLTDKQKKIYENYYLEDLSLSEIGENLNISRQGVHDALKRCEKQLFKFEENLKLVDRYLKNKKKLRRIIDLSESIQSKIPHEQIALVKEVELLQSNVKNLLEDL